MGRAQRTDIGNYCYHIILRLLFDCHGDLRRVPDTLNPVFKKNGKINLLNAKFVNLF